MQYSKPFKNVRIPRDPTESSSKQSHQQLNQDERIHEPLIAFSFNRHFAMEYKWVQKISSEYTSLKQEKEGTF